MELLELENQCYVLTIQRRALPMVNGAPGSQKMNVMVLQFDIQRFAFYCGWSSRT